MVQRVKREFGGAESDPGAGTRPKGHHISRTTGFNVGASIEKAGATVAEVDEVVTRGLRGGHAEIRVQVHTSARHGARESMANVLAGGRHRNDAVRGSI